MLGVLRGKMWLWGWSFGLSESIGVGYAIGPILAPTAHGPLTRDGCDRTWGRQAVRVSPL